MLLLAAIVTDILVLSLVQSVMVRSEISLQRSFLTNAGSLCLDLFNPDAPAGAERNQQASHAMLGLSNLPSVLVIDRSGNSLYRRHSKSYSAALLQQAAVEALKTPAGIKREMGSVWSAFWWHPDNILIALPLEKEGRIAGAASAIVPLQPIYAGINKYHKLILIYILFNTAVLSLLCLFRIFKIYFRPIDRLIHQADKYQENEDLFFAFRREDSELNSLSSALNRMVNKISRDKKLLKETVDSLEKSNAELKKAQNDIIRAEKMASVGRLAAGIAHEIGNPIGIVLGYIDLLKRSDLEQDERMDCLQRTEKETQRINTIIRQLLDLSRSGSTGENRSRFSLSGLIAETVEVMRLQPLMKGIRIQTRFGTRVDYILADGDQLRQVFVNLLLNSADAIRSRTGKSPEGLIEIQTEESLDPPQSGGRILGITFQDNGPGIEPDLVERIFDPFYTTKEPGKGTGLGLSVSYMIIEKIGGKMFAECRPGEGLRMIVRIPAAGCREAECTISTAEQGLTDD